MASTDLCSVAEVREFLQKPQGDQEQDAILGALITRASVAIMRECEREFAPTSTALARKFEIGPDWASTILSLAPYDLRAATTVKLDTDLTPYTLSTSEYRLGPKPNRDGTYTWIRLRPQSNATANWFPDFREVEITGNWGFAAVPDDVKHAAVVTSADWFRRDVAAFSTTFSTDTGDLEVPQSLPRGVLPILASYKRHSYV